MGEERKSRYELFLEEEARKAQPTKRCSKCGKEKAKVEFWKDVSAKSGVVSRCKECSTKRVYKNREDRFWKAFHAKTRRVGECLEWTGAFATMPICAWDGKKSASVRRIVYRLSVGELPDDMYVTPICRNERCVRQSHLKRITRDEYRIMLSNVHHFGEGSHPGGGSHPHPNNTPFPKGEKHPCAKLTCVDIPVIRRLRTEGLSLRAIARKFGVSSPTILFVLRGETWAHVQ